MSILDYFSVEMNLTFNSFREKNVTDPSTGKTTKTEVGVVTGGKTFLYRNSHAEKIIEDRFETTLNGILIMDPGLDVAEKDRIHISDSDYIVVFSDDIAYQGEVLQVFVRKKT